MKKLLINLSTTLAILASATTFAASSNPCVTNLQSKVTIHGYTDSGNPAFKLSLNFCNLNDEDVPEVVDFLNKNKHISSVELFHNNIHAQGAAQLTKLTSVVTLDLSSNYIDDEAAIALTKNATFVYLWLDSNQVTDIGAIELAHSKSLVFLDLNYNFVTDKGAIELAKNPNLKLISLERNRIGDEGAIALANDNNLEFLYLNGNRIGDAGALAFAQRTQYILLSMFSNNISASAREAILANKNIAANVESPYYDVTSDKNAAAFRASNKHVKTTK